MESTGGAAGRGRWWRDALVAVAFIALAFIIGAFFMQQLAPPSHVAAVLRSSADLQGMVLHHEDGRDFVLAKIGKDVIVVGDHIFISAVHARCDGGIAGQAGRAADGAAAGSAEEAAPDRAPGAALAASLTPTPSETPSSTQLPAPSPAPDPLGAWRFYTDVWTLPLSHSGLVSGTQALNHERNLDFAAFLYAEGDDVFVLDQAGPVCLTHAFFALARGSINDASVRDFRVTIEVDGTVALHAPWGEVFMAPEGAAKTRGGEVSAFALPPAPAEGISQSSGWRGVPSLPQPLTFSVEHEVSLRSGFVLQAPVCAANRVRMSFRYSGGATGAQIIEQGSTCVADDSACEKPQYSNVHYLRFPDGLPPGVAPWKSSKPAFGPEAAAALPLNDVRKIWSPLRLMEDAIKGGDTGASMNTCGNISAGGSFTLFVWPPAASLASLQPGLRSLSLLTLDFPDALHLLHSRHVRLQADWDGGAAAGGGSLDVDLESLLGPAHMVRHETGVTKEWFFIGQTPAVVERPAGDDAIRLTPGLYIALPMPFYKSADVRVVFSGTEADLAATTPTFDRAARRLVGTTRVCSAAVVAGTKAVASLLRRATAEHGAIAYLQGGSRDTQTRLSCRSSDNVLLNISRNRGSLVYLSSYVRGENQFFVENDVRAWVDGNPSPALWESGWEDAFGGSHGYNYVRHRRHALFGWDRVDSNLAGPGPVHTFQARCFLLDAVRFGERLVLGIEMGPEHGGAVMRTAALWYGSPTAGESRIVDTFRPGSEFALPGEPPLVSLESHSYELVTPSTLPKGAGSVGTSAGSLSPPAATTVQVYAMRSVVPSQGEDDAKIAGIGKTIGGGTVVDVPRVLAVSGSAVVTFTVASDPMADAVLLRRLVDVRYSVQHATVSVDGERVGVWLSADRSFSHLDTHWRVDTFALPPRLTRGKATLGIRIDILQDSPPGGPGARYHYAHQLGRAWTEAEWSVVALPHLAPTPQ
jgi:hypothetical protein